MVEQTEYLILELVDASDTESDGKGYLDRRLYKDLDGVIERLSDEKIRENAVKAEKEMAPALARLREDMRLQRDKSGLGESP